MGPFLNRLPGGHGTRWLAGLVSAVVLAPLVGCVEVPLASSTARELAAQVSYPQGAYPISSTFRDSHDSRGIRRRTAHSGVDIRAPEGTPVVAAAGGRVRVVEDPGVGRVILLEAADTPEPMVLEFAHLALVRVRTGDQVARGQSIATVGRSGRDSGGVTHLHFAVAIAGKDLVDPVPLLIGEAGIVCVTTTATLLEAGAPATTPPALVYPVACMAP